MTNAQAIFVTSLVPNKYFVVDVACLMPLDEMVVSCYKTQSLYRPQCSAHDLDTWNQRAEPALSYIRGFTVGALISLGVPDTLDLSKVTRYDTWGGIPGSKGEKMLQMYGSIKPHHTWRIVVYNPKDIEFAKMCAGVT